MRIVPAILGFIPALATAGVPVTTPMTCPIGGEVFEITETASCTTYPDRTMSFAPTSSCDFVTRLPQCPGNFLPVYKDFSDDDLALLSDYMLSESYDSNVDGSRYYLAYIIEKYLTGPPEQAFWLLLNGLWYDPGNTFDNPQHMDAFFFEAVGQMNRTPPEDLPYIQAIVAYAYANNNQPESARALLEKITDAGMLDGPLPAYVSRIRGCISNPDDRCAPTEWIVPH